MKPKDSNKNPQKQKLIRSDKILLEVEQKMLKGEPVDVIIGAEEFLYKHPGTKKNMELEEFKKDKNLKDEDPKDHQVSVSLKDVQKKLEQRLKEKKIETRIKTTDFFLSVTLDPLTIREIAGEIEGKEGIKEIHRIWLNKKTEAQLKTSNDTIKASAVRKLFNITGKGIRWAIIDSGIDLKNEHIRPAVFEKDEDRFNFSDDKAKGDFNGHGTHVAGIIASQSEKCPGIAQGTKLYDFKALDKNGNGTDFSVIQAMAKIRKLNFEKREMLIHGVNISLGSMPIVGSYGVGQTPICQEANRLMRSGVVVVVAAGNSGHKILAAFRDATNIEYFRTFMDLSIADPGNAEDIITVGSVHKENPHFYGISYFSAKGPTGDGRYKPDVVAPGERIDSLGLAKDDNLDEVTMSGTSMAAPHVSGAIALFLSAKKEFIGHSLEVKEILMNSCTDLKREPYFQGKGMIDILRMVQSL